MDKMTNHKPVIKRVVHTIDATDQSLGRLASKIAHLLRGKHKSSFVYHTDMGDIVKIVKLSQVKITGKKSTQSTFKHYSGYPGGLKSVRVSDLLKVNPKKILEHAVWRMLPKNRLRRNMMKRLSIEL